LFDKRELQELMETVSRLPIQTFKYSDGSSKIVIKKDTPASAPKKNQDQQIKEETVSPQEKTTGLQTASTSEALSEEPLKPGLLAITAPMVGTFYTVAEQGGTPLVQVGDKVTGETVVCVLEAMKLFMEVNARVSGEIVEIVAEEGVLVEYGQTLFWVKPE
jgi:acetyl-CoA carboxylase biotin carboxyl carrier protein